MPWCVDWLIDCRSVTFLHTQRSFILIRFPIEVGLYVAWCTEILVRIDLSRLWHRTRFPSPVCHSDSRNACGVNNEFHFRCLWINSSVQSVNVFYVWRPIYCVGLSCWASCQPKCIIFCGLWMYFPVYSCSLYSYVHIVVAMPVD